MYRKEMRTPKVVFAGRQKYLTTYRKEMRKILRREVNGMEIKYNVSGEKRKEMVGIISKTVGADAVYKFMPTCNYGIDFFTVTKDGTLLFDDSSDSEIVEKVIEELAAAGFVAESEETAAESGKTEEPKETEEAAEETEEPQIEFSIPLDNTDKSSIENFTVMIYSKQYLINKAVGFEVIKIPFDVAELNAGGIAASDFKGFKITSENVIFYYPKADEKLKAYMDLMSKAWLFAKKSKQLQTKLIKPENEKYYMRSWLVRIGLGGKEGAETRKMLIRDLKGHSAFRTQEEIDKAKEKYRVGRNKE